MKLYKAKFIDSDIPLAYSASGLVCDIGADMFMLSNGNGATWVVHKKSLELLEEVLEEVDAPILSEGSLRDLLGKGVKSIHVEFN